MNYLVHNYAKLTKLDDYMQGIQASLNAYYTKGAADEKFVNKDTVIDGFMKEVELEIGITTISFAIQLYNDENIRQAAIDRGLNIDGYLNSDSSVIFKGHFDFVKCENNNLYFSNETQTIYIQFLMIMQVVVVDFMITLMIFH